MLYQDWGFDSSPFNTTALPPTEEGKALLVGRDKDVAALIRRTGSGTKMATLEGLNGIGKTSIVNVASYTLYQQHVTTGEGPLYIPCRQVFQLSPTSDKDQFIRDVYLQVAQTLIEQTEEVKKKGHWLRTNAVSRWLNAPQNVSFNAGVWMLQGGRQEANTTTEGFTRSGFKNAIDEWLQQIFPSDNDGGVLCVIDNLELLQSSEKARQALEELRDELFNIKGLRWILCGALGIVRGIGSTPRLDGFLHDPIEVKEIQSKYIKSVLEKRISSFANSETPYLPITEAAFEKLYGVLDGNIRSTLGQADNFCQWAADKKLPNDNTGKNFLFDSWLDAQARKAHEAAQSVLTPRAYEIFEKACELSVFSPSQFEEFSCNSIAALRPYVKNLEDVGALVGTRDDGDRRRKSIQVTAKGWLIHYHKQRQRELELARRRANDDE